MKKQFALTFISQLSFVAFSIILSSCGGGKSSVQNTFSVSAVMSEERALSDGERNVAARICYAYQSKSKNFRGADFLGTKFVFTAKNTDCQKSITSYQINTTLKYDSNNNLTYVPKSGFDTTLKFVGTVQTDTYGYLSQLCDKIKNNQTINNTTTQQNVKVQITFIREGLDGFYLQYFNKQNDGSYKIDSAEKFKIRTQIDYSNGQILGMDEYYSTQKVCSSQYDKNANSDFEQTFTSH